MHKSFGILVIVAGLAGTAFGSFRAYHDSFMASATTPPEAPVGLLLAAFSIVLVWLGVRIGSPWLEKLRHSDWEQHAAQLPRAMAAAESQTAESETAQAHSADSPAEVEPESPEPVGAGWGQS